MLTVMMPALKTAYASVTPFITKDGSQIRELMHPAQHGNHAQSFAEAIVAPGMKTLLHKHRVTEEIYHINGTILRAIYHGTHGIRGKNKNVEFFCVFRVFRGYWFCRCGSQDSLNLQLLKIVPLFSVTSVARAFRGQQRREV